MREGAAAVANFLAKMWCLYCLSLHLEEALSLGCKISSRAPIFVLLPANLKQAGMRKLILTDREEHLVDRATMKQARQKQIMKAAF